MSNQSTRPSRRSSSRSGTRRRRPRPAIVITFRSSPYLQLLWVLWTVALAAALLFGLGAPLWVRLLLVGLAACLAQLGLRALRRPGRGLVRISWGSDGRWQAQDANGKLHYVDLTAPPQAFGPLLWLRLKGAGWCGTVLIDGWRTEPVVFRSLKARLRTDLGS